MYKTACELVGRGGLGVAALLGPQAVPCALLELYGGKPSKKRPLEEGKQCHHACLCSSMDCNTMTRFITGEESVCLHLLCDAFQSTSLAAICVLDFDVLSSCSKLAFCLKPAAQTLKCKFRQCFGCGIPQVPYLGCCLWCTLYEG